jgi:hypothetical protein
MIQRISSAVAFLLLAGGSAAQLQTFDRTYDLWNAQEDECGVAIKPFIEQGYLVFSNVSMPAEGWFGLPYITLIGPNGDHTWDRVFEPELPYMGMHFSAWSGVDHRPGLGYVACGSASDTAGNIHGFVLRLNTYGQEEWRVFEHTSNNYNVQHQARFTDDGGVMVLGSRRYSGAIRSCMIRLAPDGSELWNRIIGPFCDGCWSGGFTQMADGGFVLVGQQAQEDQYVPWMGRFTAAGELVWERTYEVEDPDVSFSDVEWYGNDRFMVRGLNSIPLNEHNDQYKDVFAMVDSMGTPIWTTTIGEYNERIACVGFEVVEDAGLLAFGYGRAELGSFGDQTCAYLLAIDQFGDSIASMNVAHVFDQDSVTAFARVFGMLQDEANGRLLFVGGAQGRLVQQQWTTEEDTWVFGVDMSACPMLECAEFEDLEQLVGIPEHTAGSMMIYPNPVHSGGVMNLVLPDDLSPSTGLLRMSLFGSDGRMVRDLPIDHGPKGALSIPINDLAPGAYSVMVEFAGRAAIVQKVMVQ